MQLFSLFGWALFAAGLVVAVFDTAIEYQTGRANIQSTCLNVLKGFMAVSLFTKVPVELYKFCITLQTTFSGDLIGSFVGATRGDLGATAEVVLKNMGGYSGLLGLLTIIMLAYCVVKLFFANIKRGGILLCQIAVGSLYMFSIPRGFSDGFNGWCKQIFALCLTAFLQTSLMFLGLLTWQTNMLLGLGIMLAANEVPRIAQQFGLDTSVRVNMMSVTSTVNTAVRAGQFVAKKAGVKECFMKTYIYPQNLKAASRLWLWSIRDFLLICLGLILSVVILTQLWTFLPFAITAVFAFLSIRFEETTVVDYMVCAFRFFVTAQQIYFWR